MTAIAKLFKSGNSQAVRLPKEFRFEGDSVYIEKHGDGVLLLPIKDDPWQKMIESLEMFPDDFMETRDQGVQRERENPFD
jgi:antitoxin VapB